MAKPKQPKALPPVGTRIKHTKTGQAAMVSGRPQYGWRVILMPVTFEQSTYRDLWPIHLCKMRPQDEQPKKLGGSYKPPKNFPLSV